MFSNAEAVHLYIHRLDAPVVFSARRFQTMNSGSESSAKKLTTRLLSSDAFQFWGAVCEAARPQVRPVIRHPRPVIGTMTLALSAGIRIGAERNRSGPVVIGPGLVRNVLTRGLPRAVAAMRDN